MIFYKYHIALFENKCLVIQVNEICAPDNSIMSWTVKHIPRIQKYEIIFFIKKSSYIFSKPLRNNDMSLFLINLMNCMKSVLMVCLMSCFEQNNWFPSHVSVNILFMIKRLFSPYETKSIEITTISWCEIYCFGTMMSVHPIFLYLNAYNF